MTTFNPPNDRLAYLVALPNLDTISDVARLRSLTTFALARIDALRTSPWPRRIALGLYADRAAARAEALRAEARLKETPRCRTRR